MPDPGGRKCVTKVVTAITLGLLVCFLSAPAPAAQAVSDSAQVVGYVRDEASHEPIVSVRVDLISQKGFAAPSQYTDTNGEFHFDHVHDGDYQVNARKIGYVTAQVSVSVIGGHESNVNFDLRRESSGSGTDSNANKGGPETVSAHELKVPEKARAESDRAKALMAKSDFDGAIVEFQKAIDDFPSYYEAYSRMGVAQYMGGHAVEARASFQKAIDLSGGKYEEALFDLANVLNDTNDFSGAEAIARQQIALDESSWEGYFQLARALLGMQKYADAEVPAKKCRELNARYHQIYIILTNIHIGMRDYPAVLQDIDAYLKLDSSSPAAAQMRTTRAQVVKALAKGSSKPEQNQNQNQDQKPQ
jgi:tetratricopeptide (TPR) repeat protein